MVDEEKFKRYLENLPKSKRRHASFFDYPDKQVKELGIMNEFVVQLENMGNAKIIDWEPGEDPPDIKATDLNGNFIGIEITELVNQRAVEKEIQRNPEYYKEYFSWDEEKVRTKILDIVETKNRKLDRLPDRYRSIVLLIHTDEPFLSSDKLIDYLKSVPKPEDLVLSDCYVLVAYEPQKGGYTLIKVF